MMRLFVLLWIVVDVKFITFAFDSISTISFGLFLQLGVIYNMARIKIKIDKNGNPTILDVCGEGTNCLEATKNFEKALGTAVESSRQLTENYYEGEAEENLLTNEGDGEA